MTTAIVKHIPQEAHALTRGLSVNSVNDLNVLGALFAKSGYFKDAKDAAQACIKVQAGAELGIPPVQSMMGIYIVEGKLALSAGLIATLVKRSGKYNYRVTKHDESGCAIAFFEGKEKIGESTFTMADAERAGLGGKSVWKAYRRNMLFARAMSNGARWYTPDIFGGPVYTPEELGAEVDGDGEPVTVAAAPALPAPPAETSKPNRPAPSGDPIRDLMMQAKREMQRLRIGHGMTDADAKAAYGVACANVNGGRPPETVEEWARVLEVLREEPTPPAVDDEASDAG